MATLPRRIVALSVGVVLLVGLATASVASARSTLVWTGGNSARPNEPFTRFTTATGSKYRNDLNELVPGVDKRDILPSNMSQYKCVMLWLNATPPAAFDTLNNYMLGGGTVVAVGEYGPDYGAGRRRDKRDRHGPRLDDAAEGQQAGDAADDDEPRASATRT